MQREFLQMPFEATVVSSNMDPDAGIAVFDEEVREMIEQHRTTMREAPNSTAQEQSGTTAQVDSLASAVMPDPL